MKGMRTDLSVKTNFSEKTLYTIVRDYYQGGFKTVDYPCFISSLKETRIKRLNYIETKWIKLLESTMEISINTIWQKGRDFSYPFIKMPITIF